MFTKCIKKMLRVHGAHEVWVIFSDLCPALTDVLSSDWGIYKMHSLLFNIKVKN